MLKLDQHSKRIAPKLAAGRLEGNRTLLTGEKNGLNYNHNQTFVKDWRTAIKSEKNGLNYNHNQTLVRA
jgi:hypothetical protein